MSVADTRDLAITLTCLTAPGVLVFVFAILRGYTVTFHMTREGKPRDRNE